MYILTGGAGFIGSAMLAKLNEEGIEDVLVVDSLASTDKWKNLVGKRYVDYLHKDVFIDMVTGDSLSDDIDGIIHLGACSSTTERDVDYLMENNFHYTAACAEWAVEHDVRFIYASSAATYGAGERGYSDEEDLVWDLRPLNMYGYSKQLADEWALRTDALDNIVGLKFFNVYGPNEYHKGAMCSVVNKAYHQIKKEGKAKLFRSYNPEYQDGEQLRDFIYIKDCTDILWWLLNEEDVMGIYNIGTGKARTWNALVTAIFSALDMQPSIEYIDMPDDLVNQYQYFTEAKMEKLAETDCPLEFQSLEDGIRDYVTNYLESDWAYL